jgi:putative redox protein
MVEIRIGYDGELRCTAAHGPSDARLCTDAPVDNHGRGESFSPTDLLATALGTCMVTVMGITARTRGWDLAGTRARVVKRMVADPARRVGGLAVSIEVPADPGAEARRVLEETARGCPVARSLAAELETTVAFRWGVPVG